MSTPTVIPGGRVVELTAANEMHLTTRPDPEVGPGQVVVNVRALGLCGTDLHIYTGRGGRYPWVVGHDGTGVVHAIGAGVTGVELGQRVAVDPVIHCGRCAACTSGKVQLCATGGYLGMLGPGLAAQYVLLPAEQLVPLPDSVSDLAATVLEPVTVALHTLRRVAPLMPEAGNAVVVGGGPLGLLQAKVMQHLGWRCVVVEPRPQRREFGASLGLEVHDVSDPALDDLGAEPMLVVETSATGPGVDLADRLATPGSVVAVVGRAPHSIPPPSVLLKELSILGIKGGPGLYPDAVQLVAEGVVDPAAVITHQYSWNDAAIAFNFTSGNPDSVMRSVLRGEW